MLSIVFFSVKNNVAELGTEEQPQREAAYCREFAWIAVETVGHANFSYYSAHLCTLQFPTTSRSMFARFICGLLVEKVLDLVSSKFAKLKQQTLKAQRTVLQQHKGQTLYTVVTILQFFLHHASAPHLLASIR